MSLIAIFVYLLELSNTVYHLFCFTFPSCCESTVKEWLTSSRLIFTGMKFYHASSWFKELFCRVLVSYIVISRNLVSSKHGNVLQLLEFCRVFGKAKEKLKRYIKDENSRYAKGVKEAKLKIDATKEKVKCLERKLWNEKAKVVSSTVSPFPMEEKIRTEVDEAHADMLRYQNRR
ncbi:uncharacterized protein LOC114181572 isoform X2 [Vigna unguiculata]|uniref:uncharacterized protein LOC114181572 isoform X2 n=1 Tax=Vigna unguiculata TaxID=3917 RepID=UPI001015EC21|nr:uncharacterized protein LOC114181572 isoform X2 [Vigna unguiculata]